MLFPRRLVFTYFYFRVFTKKLVEFLNCSEIYLLPSIQKVEILLTGLWLTVNGLAPIIVRGWRRIRPERISSLLIDTRIEGRSRRYRISIESEGSFVCLPSVWVFARKGCRFDWPTSRDPECRVIWSTHPENHSSALNNNNWL